MYIHASFVVWLNNGPASFRDDVTTEQLKSYINQQVNVDTIEKVSHVDASMQPFKVTINNDHLHTVMVAKFWPIGIKCRKFFNKSQPGLKLFGK